MHQVCTYIPGNFLTLGHNSKHDKVLALITCTLIDAPDSQPFLLILLFLYIQIDKVCLSKITKFLLIFSVLIPSVLIDNEVINILFLLFLFKYLKFP